MSIKRKLMLIVGLALLMTALLSSIYIKRLVEETEHLNFLSTARAFFQQIQLTRSWVALQGGVFVEKKAGVETNPFLKKIKELKVDIMDTVGVEFTLRNPALVTRQISELAQKNAAFKFHITSLNLINPQNAPDAFETAALNSFETGVKERFEYIESPGGEISGFRYMAPLYVEKSCLACHDYQNYKEGQVRGGISVTLPAGGVITASLGALEPFIITWVITILTVILIIYLTFNHFVIAPLKFLAAGCEKVSAGDYSRSIKAPAGDEIGSLAEAFDKMRATAYDYMTGLEKKVEERTADLASEQKKADEARDLAEKASRAKSDFLAMMSHEIRTPLNAVTGFCELFDKKGLSEEQAETLGYIRSSGRFLSSMINDILDFSKIEAGKLDLENAPFTVSAVIEETVSILSAAALKKNLSLKCEVDGRLKYTVIGDCSRLMQVVLNLMNNAVKFTPEGSVRARVDILEETGNRVKLNFEVADDGPGIAADKLERIFKPFDQADSSTARIHGGTGLGLAIADNIVRLMGGERIFVESETGRGSRFYFTLGFEKGPETSEMNKPESAPAHGGGSDAEKTRTRRAYKILLAEDNPMNVKLVTKLLLRAGHELRTAGNGREAYEMACAEKFDAVLMDIQMPVLNGLDATRLIRAAGINIPIIAITAGAVDSEREAGLDAGMDDYMTKPLNVQRLEALIRELIEKKSPEQ
ncbi:MAG: hypothetical protein A2008_00710 [Candidatus Wallbacteria bacterium GWC2_49_35]|uniref:histidine kinase n=1 Tax=Candidatus Wallbacteria bacterium GWC2_49_35 TaxID=1817813 RepID=A0A1F7WZE4_9BACT|nr:MAG: hypothetical protein A2008_00710 [Candidatus Wallbacteria bacterium GWC2_49_35]